MQTRGSIICIPVMPLEGISENLKRFYEDQGGET